MFYNLLSLRNTFLTKHYTWNDFCLCPRVLENMEEGHRKATKEMALASRESFLGEGMLNVRTQLGQSCSALPSLPVSGHWSPVLGGNSP